MKNPVFLFLGFILLLSFFETSAQEPDWQWSKRGGGYGPASNNPSYYTQYEKANDVTVDSQNNYYIVGEIGNIDVTFDDIPISTFNSSNVNRDAIVISFTCDGSYRWHKVFGGNATDHAFTVTTDDEDGIYVSGFVMPIAAPNETHVHFDSDSIMGQATSSPNVNNKQAFLIKYDQDGDFEWLRMPESDDANLLPFSSSFSHYTEPDGTTHLLAHLHETDHLNGLFPIENDNTLAVIKYDANGDLLDYFALPIINDRTYTAYYTSFEYDENLQRYYIGVERSSFDYMEINGTEQTNSFSLVALDQDGQYLWQIDNQHPVEGRINNIHIDEDSNIYVLGTIRGVFGSQSAPEDYDSFAGYESTAIMTNGVFGARSAFIVKLDSNGNLIWGNNPENSALRTFGLDVDDDYVYFSMTHASNKWDGFEFVYPQNTGVDPFIAVLDKQTGALEDYFRIEGIYDGSTAEITTLKKDKAGNLLTAGMFVNNLFIPYGPELALSMHGPHGDIFVAKWGTDACEPQLSNQSFDVPEHNIHIYPNPTNTWLNIASDVEIAQVEIYTLQGKLMKQVKGSSKEPIAITNYKTGMYIVKVTTQTGIVSTHQLLVK